MKIQTIVRGSVTISLKDELAKEGVEQWRSWEVHDFGSGEGRRTTYRGQEFTEQFARKTAIEMVVQEGDVDRVVDAIVRVVRASGVAEGEILVQPIARTIRIAGGAVEELRAPALDSQSQVTKRHVA
jgi:nitrogen regulatory protein P-II 1